jgi:TusA-related sulfurtransferase
MESFDSRNTITPLFLLEVTNAFRRMPPGEGLEIIADDAGIAADLKSILAACKHELTVVVERMDETGSRYKIWLLRKPRKENSF